MKAIHGVLDALGSLALLLLAACSPKGPSTHARAGAAARVTSVDEAWTRLCEGPESFPMEIAGGREFVSVTLPGAKTAEPLRFHIDTGGNTPGLMLLGSVAARLGFANADALPHTIRIDGRDIPLPAQSRWILLDAEGAEGKFERAVRRDFSVGQIGAGFLSRFVVCIDPGKQRIGFGDPKELDLEPGAATWLPLFMLESGTNHALYPFVHILLGEPGHATGGYGVLLDTGATTSMLDRNKVDYQRARHPDWPTANGAFGDADMVGGAWSEAVLRADDVVIDAPRAALPKLDVGPATFVDRPTGTWSKMFGDVPETMGSHGAIANDVLLRFRLLIDYPHARLYTAPAARAPDASSSTSRVGVSLVFDARGCPQISQITDNNAKATRDALRVGDVILSIDGRDACKLWHHEIAALLSGAAGDHKRLRLRRDGNVQDVDAVTADLLPRTEKR